jgi:hypothetical protein
MSDGNGIPNTSDTRARLQGLNALDRTLAEQRYGRATPVPEPTPSRSLRVEAGLAALEEAEREREALRGALAQAETDLRGVRAELDMVNLAHTRVLGEMDRYQRDRDEAVTKLAAAVTKLAAVEAIYDAVLVIMQRHRGAIQKDDAPNPEDY